MQYLGGFLMTIYYQIDMNIAVALLLTLVSVVGYVRLDRKQTIHKVYLLSSFLMILVLLIEVATVLINGKTGFMIIVLQTALLQMLYIIGPILTMLWFLMIKAMLIPSFEYSKRTIISLLIPQVFHITLILLTPWTNWVFKIENGLYIRGVLYPITTIFSYSYLVLTLFLVLKYRKTILKKDFILLIITIILPIVGGIVQGLFYGILLTGVTVAFSLILMFLFLQQRLIYHDFLTGAWTRESFFEYVKHQIEKSKGFGALYFDLNNLKYINDHFGHHYGDVQLVKMVATVKEVLGPKSLVARIGGDEFIAVLDIKKQIELDQLIHEIKRNIQDFNEKTPLNCPIGVAIGSGIFIPKKQSFDDFLNDLDKKM